MKPFRPKITAGLAVFLCFVMLLASCQSLPFARDSSLGRALSAAEDAARDPFHRADQEISVRNYAGESLLKNRNKPVTAEVGKRFLTLADCRAIALKNNLDIQVAAADELTKKAVEYSNRTRMLPHFTFNGDLSYRDNLGFSYSDVLGKEGLPPGTAPDQTGVTNYSTGHERTTWRYVLETRWSPVDAALAYYLTRNSCNDTERVRLQRVRIAQKLVAMVDGAYFRLLAAQEGMPLVESLLAKRAAVADKVKKLYEKKLVGVEDYHRSRQQLARARLFAGKIRTQIERQRNILASAMALSPEYCIDGGFSVVGDLEGPSFDMKLCDMEIQAIRNRPEALDAGLTHLNSENDLKRTLVKYSPKVSVFWRFTRDKDKFLYNKDWKEVGLSVYFDLLDLVANMKESQAAGSNAEKTFREIGSVALGITSQVRVAALQYFDSVEELHSTRAILDSSQEVVRVASDRASKDDMDKVALEDIKANLLQDSLELKRTLGEANAALAELQGAMGVNYH